MVAPFCFKILKMAGKSSLLLPAFSLIITFCWLYIVIYDLSFHVSKVSLRSACCVRSIRSIWSAIVLIVGRVAWLLWISCCHKAMISSITTEYMD